MVGCNQKAPGNPAHGWLWYDLDANRIWSGSDGAYFGGIVENYNSCGKPGSWGNFIVLCPDCAARNGVVW